jgi:RNA polymerase sigma-70 factor (ECF subfamily)
MMGPEALGRLMDEQAGALVLYARQWSSMPEDIVQEAFLKLCLQAKLPPNPVAWLYRVVRNAAISAARAEQRRQRHEREQAARKPSWFLPETEGRATAEAVTTALQSLALEKREVIVAHVWGGLTFEQIGELTNSSSSSAHRIYATGLKELREQLEAPCRKNHTIPD